MLDNLPVNTTVKMLGNELEVCRNDNHQEPTVILFVQIGPFGEDRRFIEKSRDFGPTLLHSFKSGFNEKGRHLFFGEFPPLHPTKKPKVVHRWESNLFDECMLTVGGRACAIHSFFNSQPDESHYFRSMYKTLKPLIFRLQPEKAHEWTMTLLTFACAIPGVGALLRAFYAVQSDALEVEVAGLKFPNPVGLAAGFDKDARWLKQMRVLGFGFVEIGTVTPLPQDGNPKPRLFRLPDDKGIINRMGFNNSGMAAAAARLRRRPPGLIVGGNIGKNKITPNERAESDYVQCFNALYDDVDYFVVNVSSPNTPGLRELQEKEPLQKLLETLMRERSKRSIERPIFLKIAPDLTNNQLDDIVELVQAAGIAGVIATNTTISRKGLKTPAEKVEHMGGGGLSGAPLGSRSTEVIRYLHEQSKGAFPIIGVGGICGPEDAQEKLDAGASLVQVYSGLIHEGPALVKRINQGLIAG